MAEMFFNYSDKHNDRECEDRWEDMTLEQELQQSKILAAEYINSFVNEIKTVDKETVKTTAVPVKMKLPFKIKVKRFFNKLLTTIS